MNEMKVILEAPELVEAIKKLAEAMAAQTAVEAVSAQVEAPTKKAAPKAKKQAPTVEELPVVEEEEDLLDDEPKKIDYDQLKALCAAKLKTEAKAQVNILIKEYGASLTKVKEADYAELYARVEAL